MSGDSVNKINDMYDEQESQLDYSKRKTAFIAEAEGDDLQQVEEEFEKMSMQEVSHEDEQTSSGSKSPVPEEIPAAVVRDELWNPWFLLNPPQDEETKWRKGLSFWQSLGPVAVPRYEKCKEAASSSRLNNNKNKPTQSHQKRKPSKNEKKRPKG